MQVSDGGAKFHRSSRSRRAFSSRSWPECYSVHESESGAPNATVLTWSISGEEADVNVVGDFVRRRRRMHFEIDRAMPPFMELAEAFLESHEPLSTMLYGVCLDLQRQHGEAAWAEPDRFVGALRHQDRVLLAALQTAPYGLILFGDPALEPSLEKEARDALLDAWQHHGLTPRNVLAPKSWAESVAEEWSQRQGLTATPRLRMRLYELTEVIPPRPCGGRLRRAESGDLDLVTRWFHAFHLEAMGQDDMNLATAMARNRVPAGEVYLWQEDQPLAMVARSRATARSVSVGHVYTPPELRGRGLAANCVATFSQRLLDEGFARCTLFTDLGNPVSNRIYQRLGYRPLSDFNEMVFLPSRNEGIDR